MNDGLTPNKTKDDETPTKINSSNAVGVVLIISGVIAVLLWIIQMLLPNYLPLNFGLKAVWLCGALLMLASFIWLEFKTTEDFLGIDTFLMSKQKPGKKILFNILKILLFVYISITFLFAPWFPENFQLWKDRKAGVSPVGTPLEIAEPIGPTVTVTSNIAVETIALPTQTYSSTPNPTNTLTSNSTNTPTPSPTSTPEPTPTSTLYKYRIGVFAQNPVECTKKDENGEIIVDLDRNDEIIEGLIDLGFDATKVPYDQADFSEFDVLYMPYGWFCTKDDYESNGIWKFLNKHGTGLLIGDPRPPRGETVTLDLFDFKLYFSYLTDANIAEQGASEYSRDSVEEIYKNILPLEWSNDFPVAETNLTIEETNVKYYYYVLKQSKIWRPSFVASSEETPRFVIMPGSELSVSENAVSEELMTNIILWLAHAPKDLFLN